MTESSITVSTFSTGRLPVTVEELTAEWLTRVLGETLPGVRVSGVEIEHVNWGTATKALLRLRFDEPVSGAPERVCVKGGFDPSMAHFGIGPAYRREAEFFGRIAPAIDLPLPRCWFAGANEEQDQGVIVMDNLAAAGASFGECTQPWPVDRVAEALGVLARLHGPTWGSESSYAWLTTVTPVRGISKVLFGTAHWEQLFVQGDGPEVPDGFLDRKRMRSAMQALWSIDDVSTCCVSHGDAHIGNTYIDVEGHPAFLDWQCVHNTPYMLDVAYFLGGALSVADRRASERDLLRDYLGKLAAAGGPAVGYDQAWHDYRQQTLYGFFWALTSPQMQPREKIAAMVGRHIAAIEDHDSINLVLQDPRA
jgi:hypothetical protein